MISEIQNTLGPMGNTNEASKADLGKGIIGVFRLGHFDRMLFHGCPLLSSVPCGVPHFMGALYRFKSAKSMTKTAKIRTPFSAHFRQQHQSASFFIFGALKKRIGSKNKMGDRWSRLRSPTDVRQNMWGRALPARQSLRQKSSIFDTSLYTREAFRCGEDGRTESSASTKTPGKSTRSPRQGAV